MPIRQPGPGQMNKRGLPSAYQQFETPPAPSLRDQAVTAVKDRFVQGFTEPIKRTMAPLYGGAQPSMEDVTQATASMLPVGGLRVGPAMKAAQGVEDLWLHGSKQTKLEGGKLLPSMAAPDDLPATFFTKDLEEAQTYAVQYDPTTNSYIKGNVFQAAIKKGKTLTVRAWDWYKGNYDPTGYDSILIKKAEANQGDSFFRDAFRHDTLAVLNPDMIEMRDVAQTKQSNMQAAPPVRYNTK